MPRARDPNRDKAYEVYKAHEGIIDLVEIASQLKVPAGTVRGWKNKDHWDEQMNGTFQTNTERSNKKKNSSNGEIAKEVKQVMENKELNDKQKLFCLYYVKSFNSTKAYQKAYQCSYATALTEGPALKNKPRISSEIDRLKKIKLTDTHLEPGDIFQKYMDIAYADVTDYLEFGREEVPVMGPFGPLIDKKTKKPITKIVNTVRFKESSELDGTILAEVKQGKDGASIKLADRMKALDWLTDHMGMATEEQKARIAALRKQAEDKDKTDNEVIIKFDSDLERWGE